MDNNDKKVIGYDENTGFPIYGYGNDNQESSISISKELTTEDNEKFSNNMTTSIITLVIGIIIHVFLIIIAITNKSDPKFGFIGVYVLDGLVFDLIILPFALTSINYSNKCLRIEKNILSKAIIGLNILLFLPVLIFLVVMVITWLDI